MRELISYKSMFSSSYTHTASFITPYSFISVPAMSDIVLLSPVCFGLLILAHHVTLCYITSRTLTYDFLFLLVAFMHV